ncbi:MAG TPA: tetratricopeptide repeat protein [Chloroflexia bacterium]|nr:tetratricopeptide repeat protein [Chloroflexia bacterium]
MPENNEQQNPATKSSNSIPGNEKVNNPIIGSYQDFEDDEDLDDDEDLYYLEEGEDDLDEEDEEDEDEEYDDDEDFDEEDEDEYDDEDYDEEDEDEDPQANLFNQLASNPLFAQVQQMLAGNASGAEGLYTQARMMQATGDLEGAAQLYLDAIEEEPEHAKSYVALGQVLMAMDRPEDGQLYLQRAMEIDPNDPSAPMYLGYAYYAQNNLEKALEAFQQSVNLEPDNHIARNNLGYAQYLVGDLDNAVESFTVAGDYGSDRAYYNLGMVRLLQGNEKAAWEAYQEANDLDPYGRQIEDHLKDLTAAQEKYPDKATLLQEAYDRLAARFEEEEEEDYEDEDEEE